MTATPDPVELPVDGASLMGDLTVPVDARGVVLFAHGSGSSRHSPRNQRVAAGLQQAGLATLLIDLLTAAEEEVDVRTKELRFDIALLARRLTVAVDWLRGTASTARLSVGAFGASTGAAAASSARTGHQPGRGLVSPASRYRRSPHPWRRGAGRSLTPGLTSSVG